MISTTITGKVWKDPIIKTASNGSKFAAYCILSDKINPTNKNRYDFVDVKCFDTQAEFVEKYIKKGKYVWVMGRLEPGTYIREGIKHKTFSVKIYDQGFLCPSAEECKWITASESIMPQEEE